MHKFNEWVKQVECSQADQPEEVAAPPLAQAGGGDMETCMSGAPLRVNAHNLKRALPQSDTAPASQANHAVSPLAGSEADSPQHTEALKRARSGWAPESATTQSLNEGQAAQTEKIIQDMDTEEGSGSKDRDSEEEVEEEPDHDSNKRGGLGTSKQPSLQSKICWKIRQLQSDMKRVSCSSWKGRRTNQLCSHSKCEILKSRI